MTPERRKLIEWLEVSKCKCKSLPSQSIECFQNCLNLWAKECTKYAELCLPNLKNDVSKMHEIPEVYTKRWKYNERDRLFSLDHEKYGRISSKSLIWNNQKNGQSHSQGTELVFSAIEYGFSMLMDKNLVNLALRDCHVRAILALFLSLTRMRTENTRKIAGALKQGLFENALEDFLVPNAGKFGSGSITLYKTSDPVPTSSNPVIPIVPASEQGKWYRLLFPIDPNLILLTKFDEKNNESMFLEKSEEDITDLYSFSLLLHIFCDKNAAIGFENMSDIKMMLNKFFESIELKEPEELKRFRHKINIENNYIREKGFSLVNNPKFM